MELYPGYLALYLEPIHAFLHEPAVTDVYVNRPGEVWVERLGGEILALPAPELDEDALWRLCRQIASFSHQGISRRHPLLSATLPDGARVQIVAPPATRTHLAIAIRRHNASALPLDAYTSPFTESSTSADINDLEDLLAGRRYEEFLEQAILLRLNIVVSGGTSAGKTTLLNSLVAEISHRERLIFIEDTPELKLDHSNGVGLVSVRGSEGEARLTSEDLLQAALRMRPDRIILGELRGSEAFTFLRAINTGHPGSLTTVHADSPERALTQLAMMALQAGYGIAYGDLRSIVRDMVDVVVQVERRDGRRFIREIMMPSTALKC